MDEADLAGSAVICISGTYVWNIVYLCPQARRLKDHFKGMPLAHRLEFNYLLMIEHTVKRASTNPSRAKLLKHEQFNSEEYITTQIN